MIACGLSICCPKSHKKGDQHMSKQFTVTLTGAQRVDLWSFFYGHGAVKPRDRDQTRNLDAVLEAFAVKDIQARVDEIAEAGEGEKLMVKDIPAKACEVGSVDLKRALEYLNTIPETVPTALTLRLLAISDQFTDAKEGRPLQSVPEEKGA
jgi:hypothetical protein